jgi:hypothetical protein
VNEHFNPLDHGLWQRVTTRDGVDAASWEQARRERGYVGTCRVCGGYLVPRPPYWVGHVEWYEAQCLACGREVVAPGGRRLRRSSRHSEMPPGWWELRAAQMSEQQG